MLEATNWSEFVNKRCLVSLFRWEERLTEVTILEVSPKGDYIKVGYKNSGATDWFSRSRITLETVLDIDTSTPNRQQE
jgi:hypothetical protein